MECIKCCTIVCAHNEMNDDDRRGVWVRTMGLVSIAIFPFHIHRWQMSTEFVPNLALPISFTAHTRTRIYLSLSFNFHSVFGSALCIQHEIRNRWKRSKTISFLSQIRVDAAAAAVSVPLETETKNATSSSFAVSSRMATEMLCECESVARTRPEWKRRRQSYLNSNGTEQQHKKK